MTTETAADRTHTMTLLPPAADKCQECARDHDPSMPHDACSLYWQTRQTMLGEPTSWAVAMRHCTPAMAALWRARLTELFVDVDSNNPHPQPERACG